MSNGGSAILPTYSINKLKSILRYQHGIMQSLPQSLFYDFNSNTLDVTQLTGTRATSITEGITKQVYGFKSPDEYIYNHVKYLYDHAYSVGNASISIDALTHTVQGHFNTTNALHDMFGDTFKLRADQWKSNMAGKINTAIVNLFGNKTNSTDVLKGVNNTTIANAIIKAFNNKDGHNFNNHITAFMQTMRDNNISIDRSAVESFFNGLSGRNELSSLISARNSISTLDLKIPTQLNNDAGNLLSMIPSLKSRQFQSAFDIIHGITPDDIKNLTDPAKLSASVSSLLYKQITSSKSIFDTVKSEIRQKLNNGSKVATFAEVQNILSKFGMKSSDSAVIGIFKDSYVRALQNRNINIAIEGDSLDKIFLNYKKILRANSIYESLEADQKTLFRDSFGTFFSEYNKIYSGSRSEIKANIEQALKDDTKQYLLPSQLRDRYKITQKAVQDKTVDKRISAKVAEEVFNLIKGAEHGTDTNGNETLTMKDRKDPSKTINVIQKLQDDYGLDIGAARNIKLINANGKTFTIGDIEQMGMISPPDPLVNTSTIPTNQILENIRDQYIVDGTQPLSYNRSRYPKTVEGYLDFIGVQATSGSEDAFKTDITEYITSNKSKWTQYNSAQDATEEQRKAFANLLLIDKDKHGFQQGATIPSYDDVKASAAEISDYYAGKINSQKEAINKLIANATIFHKTKALLANNPNTNFATALAAFTDEILDEGQKQIIFDNTKNLVEAQNALKELRSQKRDQQGIVDSAENKKVKQAERQKQLLKQVEALFSVSEDDFNKALKNDAIDSVHQNVKDLIGKASKIENLFSKSFKNYTSLNNPQAVYYENNNSYEFIKDIIASEKDVRSDIFAALKYLDDGTVYKTGNGRRQKDDAKRAKKSLRRFLAKGSDDAYEIGEESYLNTLSDFIRGELDVLNDDNYVKKPLGNRIRTNLTGVPELDKEAIQAYNQKEILFSLDDIADEQSREDAIRLQKNLDVINSQLNDGTRRPIEEYQALLQSKIESQKELETILKFNSDGKYGIVLSQKELDLMGISDKTSLTRGMVFEKINKIFANSKNGKIDISQNGTAQWLNVFIKMMHEDLHDHNSPIFKKPRFAEALRNQNRLNFANVKLQATGLYEQYLKDIASDSTLLNTANDSYYNRHAENLLKNKNLNIHSDVAKKIAADANSWGDLSKRYNELINAASIYKENRVKQYEQSIAKHTQQIKECTKKLEDDNLTDKEQKKVIQKLNKAQSQLDKAEENLNKQLVAKKSREEADAIRDKLKELFGAKLNENGTWNYENSLFVAGLSRKEAEQAVKDNGYKDATAAKAAIDDDVFNSLQQAGIIEEGTINSFTNEEIRNIISKARSAQRRYGDKDSGEQKIVGWTNSDFGEAAAEQQVKDLNVKIEQKKKDIETLQANLSQKGVKTELALATADTGFLISGYTDDNGIVVKPGYYTVSSQTLTQEQNILKALYAERDEAMAVIKYAQFLAYEVPNNNSNSKIGVVSDTQKNAYNYLKKNGVPKRSTVVYSGVGKHESDKNPFVETLKKQQTQYLNANDNQVASFVNDINSILKKYKPSQAGTSQSGQQLMTVSVEQDKLLHFATRGNYQISIQDTKNAYGMLKKAVDGNTNITVAGFDLETFGQYGLQEFAMSSGHYKNNEYEVNKEASILFGLNSKSQEYIAYKDAINAANSGDINKHTKFIAERAYRLGHEDTKFSVMDTGGTKLSLNAEQLLEKINNNEVDLSKTIGVESMVDVGANARKVRYNDSVTMNRGLNLLTTVFDQTLAENEALGGFNMRVQEKKTLELLNKMISDDNTVIVGHNLKKFDISYLYRYFTSNNVSQGASDYFMENIAPTLNNIDNRILDTMVYAQEGHTFADTASRQEIYNRIARTGNTPNTNTGMQFLANIGEDDSAHAGLIDIQRNIKAAGIHAQDDGLFEIYAERMKGIQEADLGLGSVVRFKSSRPVMLDGSHAGSLSFIEDFVTHNLSLGMGANIGRKKEKGQPDTITTSDGFGVYAKEGNAAIMSGVYKIELTDEMKKNKDFMKNLIAADPNMAGIQNGYLYAVQLHSFKNGSTSDLKRFTHTLTAGSLSALRSQLNIMVTPEGSINTKAAAQALGLKDTIADNNLFKVLTERENLDTIAQYYSGDGSTLQEVVRYGDALDAEKSYQKFADTFDYYNRTEEAGKTIYAKIRKAIKKVAEQDDTLKNVDITTAAGKQQFEKVITDGTQNLIQDLLRLAAGGKSQNQFTAKVLGSLKAGNLFGVFGIKNGTGSANMVANIANNLEQGIKFSKILEPFYEAQVQGSNSDMQRRSLGTYLRNIVELVNSYSNGALPDIGKGELGEAIQDPNKFVVDIRSFITPGVKKYNPYLANELVFDISNPNNNRKVIGQLLSIMGEREDNRANVIVNLMKHLKSQYGYDGDLKIDKTLASEPEYLQDLLTSMLYDIAHPQMYRFENEKGKQFYFNRADISDEQRTDFKIAANAVGTLVNERGTDGKILGNPERVYKRNGFNNGYVEKHLLSYDSSMEDIQSAIETLGDVGQQILKIANMNTPAEYKDIKNIGDINNLAKLISDQIYAKDMGSDDNSVANYMFGKDYDKLSDVEKRKVNAIKRTKASNERWISTYITSMFNVAAKNGEVTSNSKVYKAANFSFGINEELGTFTVINNDTGKETDITDEFIKFSKEGEGNIILTRGRQKIMEQQILAYAKHGGKDADDVLDGGLELVDVIEHSLKEVPYAYSAVKKDLTTESVIAMGSWGNKRIGHSISQFAHLTNTAEDQRNATILAYDDLVSRMMNMALTNDASFMNDRMWSHEGMGGILRQLALDGTYDTQREINMYGRYRVVPNEFRQLLDTELPYIMNYLASNEAKSDASAKTFIKRVFATGVDIDELKDMFLIGGRSMRHSDRAQIMMDTMETRPFYNQGIGRYRNDVSAVMHAKIMDINTEIWGDTYWKDMESIIQKGVNIIGERDNIKNLESSRYLTTHLEIGQDSLRIMLSGTIDQNGTRNTTGTYYEYLVDKLKSQYGEDEAVKKAKYAISLLDTGLIEGASNTRGDLIALNNKLNYQKINFHEILDEDMIRHTTSLAAGINKKNIEERIRNTRAVIEIAQDGDFIFKYGKEDFVDEGEALFIRHFDFSQEDSVIKSYADGIISGRFYDRSGKLIAADYIQDEIIAKDKTLKGLIAAASESAIGDNLRNQNMFSVVREYLAQKHGYNFQYRIDEIDANATRKDMFAGEKSETKYVLSGLGMFDNDIVANIKALDTLNANDEKAPMLEKYIGKQVNLAAFNKAYSIAYNAAQASGVDMTSILDAKSMLQKVKEDQNYVTQSFYGGYLQDEKEMKGVGTFSVLAEDIIKHKEVENFMGYAMETRISQIMSEKSLSRDDALNTTIKELNALVDRRPGSKRTDELVSIHEDKDKNGVVQGKYIKISDDALLNSEAAKDFVTNVLKQSISSVNIAGQSIQYGLSKISVMHLADIDSSRDHSVDITKGVKHHQRSIIPLAQHSLDDESLQKTYEYYKARMSLSDTPVSDDEIQKGFNELWHGVAQVDQNGIVTRNAAIDALDTGNLKYRKSLVYDKTIDMLNRSIMSNDDSIVTYGGLNNADEKAAQVWKRHTASDNRLFNVEYGSDISDLSQVTVRLNQDAIETLKANGLTNKDIELISLRFDKNNEMSMTDFIEDKRFQKLFNLRDDLTTDGKGITRLTNESLTKISDVSTSYIENVKAVRSANLAMSFRDDMEKAIKAGNNGETVEEVLARYIKDHGLAVHDIAEIDTSKTLNAGEAVSLYGNTFIMDKGEDEALWGNGRRYELVPFIPHSTITKDGRDVGSPLQQGYTALINNAQYAMSGNADYLNNADRTIANASNKADRIVYTLDEALDDYAKNKESIVSQVSSVRLSRSFSAKGNVIDLAGGTLEDGTKIASHNTVLESAKIDGVSLATMMEKGGSESPEIAATFISKNKMKAMFGGQGRIDELSNLLKSVGIDGYDFNTMVEHINESGGIFGLVKRNPENYNVSQQATRIFVHEGLSDNTIMNSAAAAIGMRQDSDGDMIGLSTITARGSIITNTGARIDLNLNAYEYQHLSQLAQKSSGFQLVNFDTDVFDEARRNADFVAANNLARYKRASKILSFAEEATIDNDKDVVELGSKMSKKIAKAFDPAKNEQFFMPAIHGSDNANMHFMERLGAAMEVTDVENLTNAAQYIHHTEDYKKILDNFITSQNKKSIADLTYSDHLSIMNQFLEGDANLGIKSVQDKIADLNTQIGSGISADAKAILEQNKRHLELTAPAMIMHSARLATESGVAKHMQQGGTGLINFQTYRARGMFQIFDEMMGGANLDTAKNENRLIAGAIFEAIDESGQAAKRVDGGSWTAKEMGDAINDFFGVGQGERDSEKFLDMLEGMNMFKAGEVPREIARLSLERDGKVIDTFTRDMAKEALESMFVNSQSVDRYFYHKAFYAYTQQAAKVWNTLRGTSIGPMDIMLDAANAFGDTEIYDRPNILRDQRPKLSSNAELIEDRQNEYIGRVSAFQGVDNQILDSYKQEHDGSFAGLAESIGSTIKNISSKHLSGGKGAIALGIGFAAAGIFGGNPTTRSNAPAPGGEAQQENGSYDIPQMSYPIQMQQQSPGGYMINVNASSDQGQQFISQAMNRAFGMVAPGQNINMSMNINDSSSNIGFRDVVQYMKDAI